MSGSPHGSLHCSAEPRHSLMALLLQAALVPLHGHRVPDLQLACHHTELTGHPLQLPRCGELCRAAGGALGSPFPPSSASWEAEWGGQQSRLAPSLHPASGNQNLFLAPVRDPQQQTQPQPERGSAGSTAAPGAGREETTGLAGTVPAQPVAPVPLWPVDTRPWMVAAADPERSVWSPLL